MPTPLTLDPGTWNSSVAAPYTLGALYETGGKMYMYVLLTDAVNASNGMVAEMASTTAYTVTVDRSGGSSLGRGPVGVFVGSVTAGNYGFIQVEGIHSAVKDAAAGLTALVKVTSHASTDGDAAPATAYTDKIIGFALAATAGGVAPVMLRIGT